MQRLPQAPQEEEHTHCLLKAPVQEERVVAVQLLKEAREVVQARVWRTASQG